jgi:hypothetical protein
MNHDIAALKSFMQKESVIKTKKDENSYSSDSKMLDSKKYFK